MLPIDLIRLILEFHSPHMQTLHTHRDIYCLVCWSYNPILLAEMFTSSSSSSKSRR